MKKVISFIIIASLCLMLVSCGSTKVERVVINGNSLLYSSDCSTVYLYAFKDADLSKLYTSSTIKDNPSKTGYIYSTEKLEAGDTIKVWSQFQFRDKNNNSVVNGTEAIVDKIVETYYVELQDKAETFIITYYTVEGTMSHTSASNKEDLKEPKMHKVEVTKDKVIVKHFT